LAKEVTARSRRGTDRVLDRDRRGLREIELRIELLSPNHLDARMMVAASFKVGGETLLIAHQIRRSTVPEQLSHDGKFKAELGKSGLVRRRRTTTGK
jgi:hypothetical protein